MRILVSIMLLSIALQAQNFRDSAFGLDDAPSQHPFWTTEKKAEVGILAGLVAADGITTERGLSQGLREANPIMRPFVTRGAVGAAAGYALGFGAGLGIVYLLHSNHHYKAERTVMRLIVASQAGVVANNIAAIR